MENIAYAFTVIDRLIWKRCMKNGLRRRRSGIIRSLCETGSFFMLTLSRMNLRRLCLKTAPWKEDLYTAS